MFTSSSSILRTSITCTLSSESTVAIICGFNHCNLKKISDLNQLISHKPLGASVTLLQVVRHNCILYFQIPHNTLCPPTPPKKKICINHCFSHAPGSTAFSQEHLKTITCAKFKGGKRGQTECIVVHWKMKYSVNAR